MQQDLGLSELKLQMNRVIVKPLSAFSANKKLTQPSEGTAHFVINEDNLTRAFNSESFHEKLLRCRARLRKTGNSYPASKVLSASKRQYSI